MSELSGLRVPRWWCRLVAAPVTVVLVVTLTEQPAMAEPEPEWEPPTPADVEGVDVVAIPPRERPEYAGAETVVGEAFPVEWPEAATERVGVPAYSALLAGVAGPDDPPQPGLAGRVQAGDLPVRVGAAPLAPGAASRAAAGQLDPTVDAPRAVMVQVADRAATSSAGVNGLLVGVARSDGVRQDASVAVEVDYSGFRHAYGGDWASRLQVTVLDGCAPAGRSTGQDCTVQEALPIANDLTSGVLVAEVPLAAGGGFTMLSVSSGPSGDNGDYTATSLTPASSWQVSQQTGAFSWSYPLRMVPGVGGPEPSLAFGYSSQAVDGRTVNTNTQGSWIGDGWDLWPGFIERSYRSCADDTDPVGGQNPNNHNVETADQCWFNDNATMSLNGQSVQLVKDGANQFRGVVDDGSRIERLFDTGLGNGTYNGEYWKVTTTDGMQYFFGRHRREGFPTDPAATNSTWTAPVFGNHPGEPCYSSGDFSGSRCTQGWRWNLDYVVDPHGNTMTLFYSREPGAYGRELDEDLRTTYHRGGYLTRIEYGTRAGSEHTATVPARVLFDVADRCLPGQTCSQSNPSAWPDVPWDQYCASAPCTDQLAPTFWTGKRLDRVRAQVWRGSSFETVESWQLRHEYLDAGASDGEGVPMWLAGITRTGHVTTAGGSLVSDPEIVFDPGNSPLSNRVNTPSDGKSSLKRFRIDKIFTESGAMVNIVYSPQECTGTSLPTPHTNTKRCFPQWYSPGGQTEELDWFHKYLVDTVVVEDLTGASPRMENHYEYVDDPAWAYTKDELIPEDKRTWSDWRGYSQVRVVEGRPEETQSATEYLYMRGMNGDRASPSGGTKSVQITDSQSVSINDHEAHAGFVREVTTLNGPGGAWVSGSINDPWRHGPTAQAGSLKAYLTGTQTVRTRTAVAGSGVRWASIATTFDTTYGMPTQVHNLGDESTSDDDTCVRYEYARNTSVWIVDKVSRVETVGVDCATTPDRPDDVLSDARTFYDDPDNFGAPPTRGLPVKEQVVDSWTESTPVWVTTSRITYDIYGRPVEVSDALDRTATTTFTPAVGGPVTQLSAVNPLGHTTTTILEPAWGSVVQESDANGRVTELEYDGFGRLTAVWRPGRDAATQTPNLEFEYLVRNDGPSAAITRQLLPSGSDYYTSITLYDGMLRERQTQVQATGGGRIVTDMAYDSRGMVEWVSKPFYDTSNDPPSTVLIGAGSVPQIPSMVEHIYDGAGRVTDEIFEANGAEVWRTSFAYGGDRVHVTPPQGGTATTTISDARGHTVALRQYHGPTPAGTYDELTYTYTLRGEMASVTDAAGNVWAYEYDQRGREVRVDDPDTGVSTKTYDEAGQLLTTTDARSITLGYTYDDLGRRTSVRDGSPTGPIRAQWVHDTLPGGLGMPTRSVRHEGGNQYVREVIGYDAAGRPTGTRVVIPSAETGLAGSYETTMTYRPDGSVATIEMPAAGDLGAEKLVFGYNDVGQQTWITSALSVYTGTVVYNTLGELTQRQLGNFGKRTVVNYTYDEPTGRLVGVSATPELKPEALDLEYSYDDAGNVVRIADSPGSATPNDTQCFRYDHVRRLTDAWTPGSTAANNCDTYPGPLGGVAPYRLVWTYDQAGNRLAQTRYGPGGGATTYTYPATGQEHPHALLQEDYNGSAGSHVNTYDYDAAGNTLERTVGGDTQTFSWSHEGQVEGITDASGTTEFVYDADGDRLIRRDPDGSKVLYLDGQELHYDPVTSTATCTRYYAHLSTQIAVRTADGVTWLVTDPQNTATVAVRESDMQVQRRRQLPFGGPRGTAPGWWAGDKGFLGGTEDPTGLTHLGARLYDPDLGRFISVDPILDVGSSQQMHGYAYANHSPITLSDPSGLLPCGAYPGGAAQQGCNSSPQGSPYVCGTAGKPVGSPVCERRKGPAPTPQPRVSQTAGGGVSITIPGWGTHTSYPHGTVTFITPDGRVFLDGVEVTQLFENPHMPGLDQIASGYDAYKADDPDHFIGLELGSDLLSAMANGYIPDVHWSIDISFLDLNPEIYLGMAAPGPDGPVPPVMFPRWSPTHIYVQRRVSSPACPNSFVPGTLVVMADGTTKPIDKVQIGDLVLATDPETGETGPRIVTETITGTGFKTLVDLTVINSADLITADRIVTNLAVAGSALVAAVPSVPPTVTATGNHPFWTPDQGTWTLATDLQPGDQLHPPAGPAAIVTSAVTYTATLTVHNLTVADKSTYYVVAGHTSVLVHNCPRFRVDSSGAVSDLRPLGRGSTGRGPRNHKEQLALEQAMSDPGAGRQLPIHMTDSRWPGSQGWVKMSQNINGVEVHYVMNPLYGWVDDFKIK